MEFAQIGPQLSPDAPEDGHSFFIGADVRRGPVFKISMELLGGAEEHGAGLAGIFADGDHVIEPLPGEFIEVL